jgi:hypothetical protein
MVFFRAAMVSFAGDPRNAEHLEGCRISHVPEQQDHKDDQERRCALVADGGHAYLTDWLSGTSGYTPNPPA